LRKNIITKEKRKKKKEKKGEETEEKEKEEEQERGSSSHADEDSFMSHFLFRIGVHRMSGQRCAHVSSI